MNIHFIAIGGAAMHSLAITMQQRGNFVTGSDDEIFDPAKSQLEKASLLPSAYGWYPERITADLDAVILGMHAHSDNPELKKALEMNLKVYSYPEFLYHETMDKTRVVIAGSHGKTTITSMVMHALRHNGYRFDYMVGSRLEGFDNMVSLSPDARIAVFEGDEYLSSCLDPRPKFHLYQPQIALISGIAWDHINVFPTWKGYVDQFRIFINNMQEGSHLVYCSEDIELKALAENENPHVSKEPYTTPDYYLEKETSYIRRGDRSYPLMVFGRHNMQNMEGARRICSRLGLTDDQFFGAMTNFSGAGKRLQLLGRNERTAIYLDFAHSPSKVEATVNAVREQFSDRRMVACLELHTYSSLDRKFLDFYRHTMDGADDCAVFYNPETVLHKRLRMISKEEVFTALDKKNLQVFTDKNELESWIYAAAGDNTVLLLMSSGTFSGINFKELSDNILRT
ncbi:MAG: peptidoglycan synthetase [Bacteroidales bacterium]|nr:peptidoglycan synthetase [Bacteroidales bacterium]